MDERSQEEQRREGELLPGLPNELALPIFQHLPARHRARCRCLSRTHLFHLFPPSLHDSHLFLCFARDYDDECFTSFEFLWFLLDPLHLQPIPLDPIPIPRTFGMNLQIIAPPKQGKILLHSFSTYPKNVCDFDFDPGDVDEEHELQSKDWQVFDLQQKKWSLATRRMPSVNLPSFDWDGFAWAVLDGYLYLAGGCDWSGDSLSPLKRAMRIHLAHLVFSEDSLTNDPLQLLQWEPLPDMTQERKLCAGFALRGCFYVVGGFGNMCALESGESYDPKAGKWTRVPHMWPHHISGIKSRHMQPYRNITVVKSELYALKHSSREVFWYDISCNEWISLGNSKHEWTPYPYYDILVGVDDRLWLFNYIHEPPYTTQVLACSPKAAIGVPSCSLQWHKLPFEFRGRSQIICSYSVIEHF